MPVLGLVALFIVVPLAELYVILKVGDAIGVPWTIGLLAANSAIGAILLRTQGRVVWRRFQDSLRAGRMPHREVQDGVLVIFGGAFLITPGFLTDVVGLVFLIPPTRALIRRLGVRAVARHTERRVARGRPRGFDVEGSATEVRTPPERLTR